MIKKRLRRQSCPDLYQPCDLDSDCLDCEISLECMNPSQTLEYSCHEVSEEDPAGLG